MRLARRTCLSILIAVALTGSLTACGDDGTGPVPTGTLEVSLIDAPTPIEGIEALTLVLSDVRVHRSADSENEDGGWLDIMPDSLTVEQRTFDLLELVNGVDAVLGEAELEIGTYTQIRLQIQEASITVSGEEFELDVPSGMQSGLKLVHPFTISTDALTSLVLDFDAARSVIETPPGSRSFVLKPTIRVSEKALTGSITGVVLPLDIGATVMAVAADSGDTTTTTFPDALTGGYALQGLLPGEYHVTAQATGFRAETDSNVSVAAEIETGGVDFTLDPVE